VREVREVREVRRVREVREVRQVRGRAPRAGAVAALVHLGLAVVLTWPLAAHLTTSLPYGTETAPTVGLFNLWTLRWNQDRAGHLFAQYWDAPIFHPTPGAFALSEPQPLTGLVFTPLSWLSGNPVLAANLLLLLVLAANGAAAARLVRDLGAAPGPALLAGILAEGMPFVASQMGVFQLTVVFPLFLLIDAVVRWSGSRSGSGSGFESGSALGSESGGGGRRAAVAIGGWLAAAFLTCGYYGLFAVIGVGLPALVLVRRSWWERERLLDLAAAAGTFAVLGLPIVLTQARITGGYHRSDDLVRNQSAVAADFWHLAPGTRGAGLLPWIDDASTGQYLYPGTALLGLAVAALLLRPRRQPDAGSARVMWFLGVGFGVSRILAFGLNLSIGGVGPYGMLRAWVPGFGSLRSPYRFAVVSEIFLVALAGLGLDALWKHPHRWARAAAVGVVVAGVVEVGIMPVRLFTVDRPPPEWAEWLDDQPPAAVAFLPFPADGHVESYAETTRHMLDLLDVGFPTVNGYSGLFPAAYDELEAAVRAYPADRTDPTDQAGPADPGDRAEALLRNAGVRYLVVEPGWLAAEPRRREWIEGFAVEELTAPDGVVYTTGKGLASMTGQALLPPLSLRPLTERGQVPVIGQVWRISATPATTGAGQRNWS
jgi:hypothetical protein